MFYLNTNTQYILFQQAQNSEIYVDKSMLIDAISKRINTGNRYICITRPRRFGKTMNANMLGAYFTKGMDGRSLFDRLAIADTKNYGKNMNNHNVIHVDFSIQPDLCRNYQDYIASIRKKLRYDVKEAYPHIDAEMFDSVSDLLTATSDTFIFILDEWDSIFYSDFMSQEDKNSFLLFLKGLLKDKPYVELAYMTGILPVGKYSSGSELNMFDEYNFINDCTYEDYFGFDESEVQALCKKHRSVEYQELKWWYNGYFKQDGTSLFNPRSVVCALKDGVCLNYWTETGPMNEIADCIEHNVDAVREDMVQLVAEIPIRIELEGYSAGEKRLDTRNKILSMMVVYGFLSYHDGYITIPNHELMQKFQSVLQRNSMGEIQQIVSCSREMLDATIKRDGEKVASILEEVHDREIPFLTYNDENSLSCVVTLCYLAARDDYYVEREAKSGKGYVDYLFTPKKKGLPAIVLELKFGRSCKEAIAQMKEKNYVQKVADCGEILLVGINYDEEKHHQCVIEEY